MREISGRLEEIPGVGPQRLRVLLQHFGSKAAIEKAAPEDIAALPGFGEALANRILHHLKG